TIRPLSCGVMSSRMNAWSIACSPPMACSMECEGKSCRVMAMSPNARSRSTTQTLLAPPRMRAMPRLTDMVVLPTPPLGEKIVMTLPPERPEFTDWLPRNAMERACARSIAPPTCARSLAGSTSRTPACMAWVSTAVSTSWRSSTTVVVGIAVRSRSANAIASGTGTPGPIRTAYSSGWLESQLSRRSAVSTTWLPGGRTVRRLAAVWGSAPRMMGIWRLPEQVLGVHAIAGLDLAGAGEETEGELTVRGCELDLLCLLLVDRQGQQRPGELLDRLGAALVGGGLGHQRGGPCCED